MEKYFVERINDNIYVYILPNKFDGKYSFVNITKGHICPCKFNSIEDALEDMNNQIKKGKVIRYTKI